MKFNTVLGFSNTSEFELKRVKPTLCRALKTQKSRGSFQCNFPHVYSTIKHLCWLTDHRTIKLQSQTQVVFLNTKKSKKLLRHDCYSCTQLNFEHVFETSQREQM